MLHLLKGRNSPIEICKWIIGFIVQLFVTLLKLIFAWTNPMPTTAHVLRDGYLGGGIVCKPRHNACVAHRLHLTVQPTWTNCRRE